MTAPTLHVLRHSPTGNASLASCMRVLASKESLLLIEDAVYALLPGSAALNSISLLPGDIHLYVLQADLLARGLALDDLPARVEPVGYDCMVELSAQSGKVVSW